MQAPRDGGGGADWWCVFKLVYSHIAWQRTIREKIKECEEMLTPHPHGAFE